MRNTFDSETEAAFALLNGNEEGFDYLFRVYYGPLTWFAQGYVSDQQTAEDVVEETFLKLLERQEVLEKPGSVKSYLYTSVRNRCIDHLRREKRKGMYEKEVIAIAERSERPVIHRIIEAETLHMIHQALSTLPPACSRVFRMFYLEGKKLQEIAAELDLSLSTVKSQKGQAIKLLRKRMPQLSLILVTILLLKYPG